MRIDIIGVPVAYGTGRSGADKGPAKLREHGIAQKISAVPGFVAADKGDVEIPPCAEADKAKWNPNMLYFKPLLDINRNLAGLTRASAATGGFALTIGGDHSAAIGSISGVAAKGGEIAVLWVDAHGDINDSASSPSKHVHGMPNAFLLGKEQNEFYEITYPGSKYKPENLYLLGQRDLDEGERKLIQKLGISIHSAEEMRKAGYPALLENIRKDIVRKGITQVHISFDIDFLDKSLVPGTGTPVTNGATLEEAKLLLATVAKWGLVRSMDFMELNPELDINDETAKISIELLMAFFSNLAV